MSVGLQGMKGHKVAVEANVRADRERCVIIGLPDASIKESKERVLSCLHATANQKEHIQQICFERKWSNRAQVKLMREARTIADLEGVSGIPDSALNEAIDFKSTASQLHDPFSQVVN